MEKSNQVLKFLAIMVLTLVLVFQAKLSNGGNPPPEGKTQGPAIIANLIFVQGTTGGLEMYGTAQCQGNEYNVQAQGLAGSLGELTAEILQGYVITISSFDDGPFACAPPVANTFVVQVVLDFNDNPLDCGTYGDTCKKAKVVALFGN